MKTKDIRDLRDILCLLQCELDDRPMLKNEAMRGLEIIRLIEEGDAMSETDKALIKIDNERGENLDKWIKICSGPKPE